MKVSGWPGSRDAAVMRFVGPHSRAADCVLKTRGHLRVHKIWRKASTVSAEPSTAAAANAGY